MSSFWRGGKGQGTGDRGQGRRNKLLACLLFTCSLSPVPSFAGPYADLDARLQGRPDTEAVTALRKLAPDDPEAQNALDRGPKAARAFIALGAALEGAPAAKVPNLGPPPADERTASSWLGRAFDRLRFPDLDLPRGNMPKAGVGPWATYVMWGLLAALGGLAVYLLARYARLPGLRKKRPTLVDEDEPVQTADEWIEAANALIAQGRFREAVRGLYVAGLMRFDEAGVARFDRHQTNWEHLRRIEASPKKPAGTEVRDATLRFDRVWYGHQTVTHDDASTMRAWYDALVRRLAEGVPA